MQRDPKLNQVALSRLALFVCPICRGSLEIHASHLQCEACSLDYPLRGGIPEFILEDLSVSKSPILRGVGSIDLLARIYESLLWYPLVLNVYGGWRKTSLPRLVDEISSMLEGVDGLILDVACGPGTFGRRLATPSRVLYGVDVSWGMLRRGQEYVRKSGMTRMSFGRARAEKLPFPDRCFEAVICCGALHLFEDTTQALIEIGRTMKTGAPLAVMTFAAGDAGILRHKWIRDHVREDHGAYVFEGPDLRGFLTESGFELQRWTMYGSVLIFKARRGGS